MTEQEAIEILTNAEVYFARTNEITLLKNAIKEANKALETRIRKKPLKVPAGTFCELGEGKRYDVLGLCPKCQTVFLNVIPTYCSNCGQAIDFMDVDESE